MGNEAHVRIDEGIPRPRKRDRPKPSNLERQARNEAGRFLTSYSQELRENAIQDSLMALECGARVEDIAKRHQVPVSTLYSWLVGDERAGKLRTQFFDGQCARNLSEIRSSSTPLELARAREELSGWIKVAERRDPKNYGIKQEHSINLTGLSDALAAISQARLGQAVDNTKQVIDVTPQEVDKHASPTIGGGGEDEKTL